MKSLSFFNQEQIERQHVRKLLNAIDKKINLFQADTIQINTALIT